MARPQPDDDGIPDTVEEIVTHLEQDPILLEEVMGNGHTAQLEAALHAKAEDANFPVFVVYTTTPSGMSGTSVDEELASLVHAGLGRDGVYVVQTTQGVGHIQVWGDIDPSQDNDLYSVTGPLREWQQQVRDEVWQEWNTHTFTSPVADAGLVLDLAALDELPARSEASLPEDEAHSYAQAMWVEPHQDHSASEPIDELTPLVIAVGTALVVFAIAYRLLHAFSPIAVSSRRNERTGRATQERARAESPEQRLERLRSHASKALASLERGLTRTDDLLRIGTERTDLARNSHQVGTSLLDSDQELDLVGALVLARTGARALDRDGETLYRCCYLNPLHGRGTTSESVGGGLVVPVCDRCGKLLRQGKDPDPLIEVRAMAIDRPYYSGTTVWSETGFGALVDDLWFRVQHREDR